VRQELHLRSIGYHPIALLLSYAPETSGTRGIRTLIAGVQDRSLPVGRWSRDEADGGILRCRTGTSWVSSRRADRYARIPSWSAREATARRRSDLAGCQRSPRPAGRRRLRRRQCGVVSCQAWIRTTVIRVKVGGPAVGRTGNRRVAPEGLEPSPLRVKAAFSATRDPAPLRPRWTLPPLLCPGSGSLSLYSLNVQLQDLFCSFVIFVSSKQLRLMDAPLPCRDGP
jgi:hypothetical protein